ncbi:MAG: Oligopeptidase [Bryobacterales bacterium]|nr:Oligopeptidase [Bryobacterales bacterium]
MSENPLLQIQFEIPFDRIEPGHVEPAVQELLKDSAAKLEALAADPAPRTFANTMLALEAVTERLDYAMSVVRHLEGVRTTPELRAAYNAVEPLVSEFYSRIPLHEGLWKQLQAFAATQEARNLRGTRLRFVTKTLDSFRRHGAELDEAGKARLAEIDVEVSKLTTKFSENVLDSTNAFELIVTDEKQLAGLPPSAIAAARLSAESKNVEGWRFTLQAPSLTPVMTYLDDRGIREQVYHAHSTRATSGALDNRGLVARTLELRKAKATLLGFRDFADFVLHDRMAHSGAHALEFLTAIERKVRHHFERENSELNEFAGTELAPWDIGYFAEKQRKALYDFDEEELRPYFSTERVVAGMFDVVERLYGIQVVEKPGVPVWHPDVKYYQIRDGSGQFLGGFYADWYPREDKRGGAWMDAFLTGVDTPGHFEPHAGCICGNMTAPIGDKPALLTHRDVETIFHEFGHLLHHTLSRVEVKSLAGTAVAWDFVELPSQIMENWCWEREALDLFARHYETGAPIPDELFQKLKRARNFRSANNQMRQLGFGIVDLSLHTTYSAEADGEVTAYARSIIQKFSAAPLPADHALIAGFTHLFGSPVGYGAGYYSYKWAEVLDADAFTRFRTSGIFNREVGSEFREHILSKGDSEDPAELYRRFMGRDPDPGALLERAGLAVQ